ncbi:hypothetical protein I6N96_11720 [Enterococcus sp. BWM-S5]|uniref:Lipoprotein n=1 Tax=Enterococcus larvae TaxID=2794352 RepID=A0ABS4CJZ7_9ENTE|nr:hypothetical protein [Enterococcus larvae]MBP1046937.1 hypothetical protein [Enterococcus larvae]
MKKKVLYIGILISMVTVLFAGCGSTADKEAGADQSAKSEKKQANVDDIRVGQTKEELIKAYGEPEKTISDNTEVIQGLTTDMADLQADMTGEQEEQVKQFFGGSEEKMQEAFTDMLDTASEGIELLTYAIDGKEINIYIVGGKVLLRTF